MSNSGELKSSLSYHERRDALRDHPHWAVMEAKNDAMYGPRNYRDRTVYTPSTLQLMVECGWKYNLQQQGVKPECKHINTLRGTGIHGTVHRIHTDSLWDHWSDIYDEERVKCEEHPENLTVPWSEADAEKDHEAVWEDGRTMVEGYVRRERNSPVKMFGTEIRFLCLVNNPRTKTTYRLSGEIDQLRFALSAMGLDIVDLKTGEQRLGMPYLRRSFQFTGYGYALLHGALIMPDGEIVEVNRAPGKITYYNMHDLLPYKKKGTIKRTGETYEAGDLRGPVETVVPRTMEDYDFFAAEMCRIIQIHRMGMCVHMPGNTTCNMCKFQHACTNDKKVQQASSTLKVIRNWQEVYNV